MHRIRPSHESPADLCSDNLHIWDQMAGKTFARIHRKSPHALEGTSNVGPGIEDLAGFGSEHSRYRVE